MDISPDSGRLVQLLSDLIAIESVNPAYAAGAPGEAGVGAYVRAFGRNAGLRVTEQEVLPGRANALIHLHVDDTAPTLLWEAHMDTVGLAGMPDPLLPRLRDGLLFGRGACDTKGALAAMLHAIELLTARRGDLACNVILAATVDEEHAYRGVLRLVEDGIKAEGAIVGEPTEVRPVIAHKGCLRFRIVAQGRAAHTSTPEEGCNAISAMARVIAQLEDRLSPELAAMAHPLCGAPLFTISLIEGGAALNVVPAHCAIAIDRRTIPGEQTEAIFRRIDAMLEEVTRNDPTIRVARGETLVEDWPLDTAPDAPIARAVAASCSSAGRSGAFIGAPYGSDASKLATLGGIPSVVLGPGAIQHAHTDREHVPVDDVVAACAVYAEAALRFAATCREHSG